MGVEPTRDRAERPPSRFEDGETHRGPYTSIGRTVAALRARIAPFYHVQLLLFKPAFFDNWYRHLDIYTGFEYTHRYGEYMGRSPYQMSYGASH
jgi:hypothetical protein